MTLILGRVSRRYSLQVTDRLVSRQLPGGFRPEDGHSNKNLLVVSARSVASIGCAGLAYVGEAPTDQWIAEIILGKPFARDEKLPLMMGWSGSIPHIGLSLAKVAAALNAAGRLEAEVSVIASGFCWKRNARSVPFLGAINLDPATRRYRAEYLPSRDFLPNRAKLYQCPLGWVDGEDLRVISQRSGNQPLDLVEAGLVDAIRQTANRDAPVGSDCVSLAIDPPRNGRCLARVRYVPHNLDQIIVSSRRGEETFPAAFTPWIIGPGRVMPPSVLSGSGWSVGYRRCAVQLEGVAIPEPPGPGWKPAGFGSGQVRMPKQGWGSRTLRPPRRAPPLPPKDDEPHRSERAGG